MTTRLYEASGAPSKSLGNGVFEAKIIQTGWNKSGTRYYSESLLEDFGPQTFKSGTLCFANHPTDAEFSNGRDLGAIMGRLVSDAEYREGALWAKVKVRPQHIEFVEEYKDSIGMSIFASGDGTEGEAEGKKGLIVESFVTDDPYTSVDFVVAAGAGGKVERMLESFKASEALSNDRREQLNTLVKDAYDNDRDTYVWVRDYDTENGVVYFDVEGPEGYGVFQQSFTVANDVAVELTGERQEVRTSTTYVPVGATDNISKENGMTPEEKAALVEEIAAKAAALTVEALKPAPSVEEGTTAATAAEVAEAVREANLSKATEKRVFETLKTDATIDDVKAVIEAEKNYAESLSTEIAENAGSVGHVNFVEGAKGDEPRALSVWN